VNLEELVGDCSQGLSIACASAPGLFLLTFTRKEPPMTTRDVVFPAGRQALYDKNRYSPAIRANGLLFVSGQVGSREDGSPEPTLEGQVPPTAASTT
jgi:enamine deaminase RidA (YjgF/YER057c/UK114 family)